MALGEYLPIGADGDQPVLGRGGLPDGSGGPIEQQRPYVPPSIPQAPTDTALMVTAATPLAPLPPPRAPASPRTSAGVGILMVGTAAAAGAYFGGAYGAGAGLLLMGATRNVVRAAKLWPSVPQRDEAIKSGTMALFGLGIGGWLAYKAYDERYGYVDEDEEA